MNSFDKYFEKYLFLKDKLKIDGVVDIILNEYIEYTKQYCIVKALLKLGYTPQQAINSFHWISQENLRKKIGENDFKILKKNKKRFYGGFVYKNPLYLYDDEKNKVLICGKQNITLFFEHFYKKCSGCKNKFRAYQKCKITEGENITITENDLCSECLPVKEPIIKESATTREFAPDTANACSVVGYSYTGLFVMCHDCDRNLEGFKVYKKCTNCSFEYRIYVDCTMCAMCYCENVINKIKCQKCYFKTI